MARLYADLSTARGRLSIVVADHRRARAAALTQSGVARARLAHAVLVDGCHALDQIAELPALAHQQAHPARQDGAGLVPQADALASVAAHLAVVLRGQGTGFRGGLAALPGFGGLAGFSGLGPNETDTSLILAAENVSLALSLAVRLVLVLARLHARRGRVHRMATAVRVHLAGRAARWVGRVASLPLSTSLGHAWPTAPAHPTAVAVAAVLAVRVMAAGRRSRLRLVGPAEAVLDLLGDLAGVVASVALPQVVLPVLALTDVVSGTRPAQRGDRGWVGFASRPRRGHIEPAENPGTGNENTETGGENRCQHNENQHENRKK